MTNPIIDGLCDEPPQLLMERPVFAQDGVLSTYRLMQDVEQFTNPFAASFGERSLHNEVRYLVNAEEAFPAMLAAIKTATGPGHFIYCLNWYLNLDVSLSGTRGGPDTLRSLLPPLAAAGVQCRAMLFRNTIMAGDQRPRKVFLVLRPGHAPPFRLAVEPFVGDASGALVPPPPPRVDTFEFLVPPLPSHPDAGKIDGNMAASIFDGSPDPWWAPGLGSGPVVHPQNEAEVAFFNALATPQGPGDCAAILDHLVPIAGAHHHKILLVNGTQGLIAFCGGIDVNDDRYAVLYDVHTQVKGPAAKKVLDIFNERWNSHPDRAAADRGHPHLGNGAPTPAERPKATSEVQVGRTYANGKRPRPDIDVTSLSTNTYHDLELLARHYDPFTGYTFAPDGLTQVWDMYRTAIANAKRFIYIENQYFVSTKLAEALKVAIPNVRHITVVCEGPRSDQDKDHGFFRTKRCIDILRSGDSSGTKIRIMTIPEGRTAHQYVHSKTMIVDDDYALVGTANLARRSFNCDSEAAIGVFDWLADARFRPMYAVAHRLRVRLWAELLGMNDADGHAQLADPIAAIVHWEEARASTSPPTKALVWEYDKVMGTPKSDHASDDEWDFARDPFKPGP